MLQWEGGETLATFARKPVENGDETVSEEFEYISVAEAREILNVSPTRIAEMLKNGELAAETNPLDRRGKLVKRADVEALARKAGRLGKALPGVA